MLKENVVSFLKQSFWHTFPWLSGKYIVPNKRVRLIRISVEINMGYNFYKIAGGFLQRTLYIYLIYKL